MSDIKINYESLPIRCEVCHMSDMFDPQRNYCDRCSQLTNEKFNKIRTTVNNKVVRGWLALFCFGTIACGPLFFVTDLLKSAVFNNAGRYLKLFPGFFMVLVIDLIVRAGLVAYGVDIGYQLVKIAPKADLRAKRFLKIKIIYCIAALFLIPLLSFIPLESMIFWVTRNLPTTIGYLIPPIICLLYFKYSKQVKELFGEVAPAQTNNAIDLSNIKTNYMFPEVIAPPQISLPETTTAPIENSLDQAEKELINIEALPPKKRSLNKQ